MATTPVSLQVGVNVRSAISDYTRALDSPRADHPTENEGSETGLEVALGDFNHDCECGRGRGREAWACKVPESEKARRRGKESGTASESEKRQQVPSRSA